MHAKATRWPPSVTLTLTCMRVLVDIGKGNMQVHRNHMHAEAVSSVPLIAYPVQFEYPHCPLAHSSK